MDVQRDPGNSVGFLIADSSRMLRRVFNERLTPLGLTQAQWRALVHLSLNEGLNQVSLAERLEVQPMTAARLIDKLAAAGFVERRPDPNDRRAQRLFLTELATPIIDQIWEIADKMYADIFAGFSAAEHDALVKALTHMRSNLATLMPGATVESGNLVQTN